MTFRVLINLGLQKRQVNFSFVSISSNVVHLSSHPCGWWHECWVVCCVSSGTRLRQLDKTWIETMAFKLVSVLLVTWINSVKMQLIDFRCHRLSHKTWKMGTLRKIFSWQPMFITFSLVLLFTFDLLVVPKHSFTGEIQKWLRWPVALLSSSWWRFPDLCSAMAD